MSATIEIDVPICECVKCGAQRAARVLRVEIPEGLAWIGTPAGWLRLEANTDEHNQGAGVQRHYLKDVLICGPCFEGAKTSTSARVTFRMTGDPV